MTIENKNRRILFYTDSAPEAMSEIDRLDQLFRQVHNRAPESEMFIGTDWSRGRPTYSVSLYYESTQDDEVYFFVDNVRKTEIITN